jgi:diketogulonate reductase-like aldo/keto reductase
VDVATRLVLSDGRSIPMLGLGVWQIPDGPAVRDAVAWALDAGVRHIDTARIYRNERGVGEAIRASGLPREDVWVTTKLFPVDAFRAQAAFRASLHRLGLDYVDLYLVHFPPPGLLLSTWRKMEAIARSGLSRSIGVSNYGVDQLDRTIRGAEIPPVLNQIQLSPYHYSKVLAAWCQTHDVVVEAYSPLTRGKRLQDPALESIARAHGTSTAQVLIRWCLQHDFVVIPKSSRKERIEANATVSDVPLTDEEMLALDTIAG